MGSAAEGDALDYNYANFSLDDRTMDRLGGVCVGEPAPDFTATRIDDRVFHSMPGDLPTLIGVQATDRIMLAPNTSSTIIGYLDHFWNGAMFGVIFVLIICWFPRPRRVWTAAAIGAAYGLAVGSGFALGPVPRSLGGDGVFSTVTVAEFQTTIYLAHFAFGVLLGLLVHVQRAPARVRTIMTIDDGAASPTSDRDGATPLAAPPELLLGVGAILVVCHTNN